MGVSSQGEKGGVSPVKERKSGIINQGEKDGCLK